jgi:hypothetical protein
MYEKIVIMCALAVKFRQSGTGHLCDQPKFHAHANPLWLYLSTESFPSRLLIRLLREINMLCIQSNLISSVAVSCGVIYQGLYAGSSKCKWRLVSEDVCRPTGLNLHTTQLIGRGTTLLYKLRTTLFQNANNVFVPQSRHTVWVVSL